MHKYRVISAKEATASTVQLDLEKTDTWRPFTFSPGQYAAISFYRHGRPTAARCFSITSSPNDLDSLQFTARSGGRYTKALTTLQPGDQVRVRGPFGGFILNTMLDGNVVFLAGGIGITPFVSMIRYAEDIRYSSSVTLIYSCHSQDDIPFFEEILRSQAANQNFKVVFVIGDGPTDRLQGQTVFMGRITPEVIDKSISSGWNDRQFFICGPPPFMRGMLQELKDHGVPKSRIKTEAFSQGKNKQTGKVKSWPTNMYAMSAAGLALGSFVVMVSDMFNTLPPSSLVGPNNVTTQKKLLSKREVDLDGLVNSFQDTDTNARPSEAAVGASQVASTSNNVAASTATTQAAAPTSVKSQTSSTSVAPKSTTTTSTTTTGTGSTGGGTTSGGTTTPPPPPPPPPPPTCVSTPSQPC